VQKIRFSVQIFLADHEEYFQNHATNFSAPINLLLLMTGGILITSLYTFIKVSEKMHIALERINQKTR